MAESTHATTSIPPHVARAAVNWLLELSSGDGFIIEQTRQQWQQWIDADPLHALAWQRIAQVDGQLRGIPAPIAMQTLAAPRLSRRHAVRLAVMINAGAGGLLAARQSGIGSQTWLQATTDLSTGTGEQRETVLEDGTRLLLNTASAVDLRFSSNERLIVLRAGEILIQSARDPLPDPATSKSRPLRVQTQEGTALAIGTRFTVRQQDAFTQVAVLEGTVELQPRHASSETLRLSAGELGQFTSTNVQRNEPAHDGANAWAEGQV